MMRIEMSKRGTFTAELVDADAKKIAEMSGLESRRTQMSPDADGWVSFEAEIFDLELTAEESLSVFGIRVLYYVGSDLVSRDVHFFDRPLPIEKGALLVIPLIKARFEAKEE